MECYNNKYYAWYLAIIMKRRLHIILDGERHHIIPRSLGGTNDADNLVKLTIREHFICHRLLCKFLVRKIDKQKAARALLAMATLHDGRRLLSSRQISLARSIYAESRRGVPLSQEHKNSIGQALKGKMIGEKNPMYGRRGDKSPKHGKPGPMLGKKLSEEAKAKLRGRTKSEDTLAKHRALRHSIETKQKMSLNRWPLEMVDAHKQAMRGSGNYNAKQWKIINQETGEILILTSLKEFCQANKLTYAYATTRKGKPYKGWIITEIL